MMLSYKQAIRKAVTMFYDNELDYRYLGSETKCGINNMCHLIACIYDKDYTLTKRKFAQEYINYQREQFENEFYLSYLKSKRQK